MGNLELAVILNSTAIACLAVASIWDAVVKRKLSKRLDEIERQARTRLQRPNEPPPVKPQNEHLG